MTVVVLPETGGGVPIYANPGDLPITATAGDVASIVSDQSIRQWDGSSWVVVATAAGAAITGVADTPSIDLINTAGTVTGDVILSSDPADAGSTIVNLSIETDGLKAQITDADVQGIFSATAPVTLSSGVIAIPQASGSADGYLDNADWTTFNNKQQAITIGTLGAGDANGLSLSSGTLTLHAATATQPGGVSTTSQSWAGTKNFVGNIHKNNQGTNSSFVGGISAQNNYGTSADGTTATCTFQTPQLMYIMQIQCEDGKSFCIHADFASADITCTADPSNIFLTSDSGVGVYVSKVGASATISFKNRTGASQRIGIQAISGNFSSVTAWA